MKPAEDSSVMQTPPTSIVPLTSSPLSKPEESPPHLKTVQKHPRKRTYMDHISSDKPEEQQPRKRVKVWMTTPSTTRSDEVENYFSLRMLQLARATRDTFTAKETYQRLRLHEIDIMRSIAADEFEEAISQRKDAESQIFDHVVFLCNLLEWARLRCSVDKSAFRTIELCELSQTFMSRSTTRGRAQNRGVRRGVSNPPLEVQIPPFQPTPFRGNEMTMPNNHYTATSATRSATYPPPGVNGDQIPDHSTYQSPYQPYSNQYQPAPQHSIEPGEEPQYNSYQRPSLFQYSAPQSTNQFLLPSPITTDQQNFPENPPPSEQTQPAHQGYYPPPLTDPFGHNPAPFANTSTPFENASTPFETTSTPFETTSTPFETTSTQTWSNSREISTVRRKLMAAAMIQTSGCDVDTLDQHRSRQGASRMPSQTHLRSFASSPYSRSSKSHRTSRATSSLRGGSLDYIGEGDNNSESRPRAPRNSKKENGPPKPTEMKFYSDKDQQNITWARYGIFNDMIIFAGWLQNKTHGEELRSHARECLVEAGKKYGHTTASTKHIETLILKWPSTVRSKLADYAMTFASQYDMTPSDPAVLVDVELTAEYTMSLFNRLIDSHDELFFLHKIDPDTARGEVHHFRATLFVQFHKLFWYTSSGSPINHFKSSYTTTPLHMLAHSAVGLHCGLERRATGRARGTNIIHFEGEKYASYELSYFNGMEAVLNSPTLGPGFKAWLDVLHQEGLSCSREFNKQHGPGSPTKVPAVYIPSEEELAAQRERRQQQQTMHA
ncbi:hypothetical protein BJ138DRAFT_1189106, partial [Hygrophoropsis aurantiaca]